MNLNNKTAIVTGGTRGIGFSIAESLCKAGVNVMICGRKDESVKKVVESLSLIGIASGVTCDVANYDDVRMLMKATKEKFGDIDILINNAGVCHNGNIEEHTVETWLETINTNLNLI